MFRRIIPLAIFSTLFTLFACTGITGALEVFERLTLKSEGNKVVIDPGYYHSKISVGKRKITLTVEVGEESKKVILELPTDQIDPDKDSETTYMGSDLEQDYNVRLQIKNSKVFTDSRVRFAECRPSESGRRGVRKIEFREKHKTRNVIFTILDPVDSRKLAYFEGQVHAKATVVDKRYNCR